MPSDSTLLDALRTRDLPVESVIPAARIYVADRLAQPSVDDLSDDLHLLSTDAAAVADRLADDAGLLREAALALLDGAWADPAERPRVERALDHVPGRLPVIDPYALAVMVLYGLYLMSRTEREVTRTFGGQSWSVRERGALAVLLGRRAGDAGPPGTVPGPPGEAHFSLLLLDIQDSTKLAESDRLRAVAWLAETTGRALTALGAGDSQVRERGDGFQIVVPEPLAGLTALVERFPPLIAGPLAGHRHAGEAAPPLKVRLGVHTDLLVHTGDKWGGEGLSFLARLTDTEEAKRQLGLSDRRLATILSGRVHEETIWRGRTDGSGYAPIVLRLAGTSTRVWLALS